MRTEFEAYLTKTEDKYLLYLDELDFTQMLKSIGRKNIREILVRDLRTFFCVSVFNGKGKLPTKRQALKSQNLTFDYAEIYVNDIVISFDYWDDGFVTADWESINKIIEGQKKVVSVFQSQILDQLKDNLDTYYFIKNDVLIQKNKMTESELKKLLMNEFERKEQECFLGVIDQDELKGFLKEEENTVTGSKKIDELAQVLKGEYQDFVDQIEFPLFKTAKKEDEFMELVIEVGMYGSDDEKIKFLSKHGKK